MSETNSMAQLVRTLLLLAALVAVPSVFARLTETEAELIERFGPINKSSDDYNTYEGRRLYVGKWLSFKSDQWSIRTLIVDGRCVQIVYDKVGSWTEEQLVAMLDSNGGHAAFKEERPGTSKNNRKWKHRDGTTAVLVLRTLTLTHPMLDRHLEKLKAQAKAESKKLPKF